MLTSAFLLFNPCSQICDMYITPPDCGDLAFPSVQVQLLKPNMKPAARNFEIQRIVRRANVRRIRGSYEQLLKVQSAMKQGDKKTIEVDVQRACWPCIVLSMHSCSCSCPFLSLSPILASILKSTFQCARAHRFVCVVYMAIGVCASVCVGTMCVHRLEAERGKRAQNPGKELRESPGRSRHAAGPAGTCSQTVTDGRQSEEIVRVCVRAMPSMAFRDCCRSLKIGMRCPF
jgi:hypothetical protein